MARNPNNALRPDHWFIAGGTGSGKTSMVRQQLREGQFKQVLFWDPEQDHVCHHAKSITELKRLVRQAVGQTKKWKIGLTVEPTPENFEAFNAIAWAIADSAHPLLIVYEEIADVCEAGKAKGKYGEILRKGRKYAIRTRNVSQRPQEAPKTVIAMCGKKWCGKLDNLQDARVMAGHLGVALDAMQTMPPNREGCHYFWLKTPDELSAKMHNFDPRK